jgi:hypothetical protein
MALLDLKLNGNDGIELMEELHQLNMASNAVFRMFLVYI